MEFTTFDVKRKENFEFYHAYASGERNVSIIGKNSNNKYFIEVDYNNSFKNLNYNCKIDLVDAVILQRMISYSFPFMIGWHVMNSNKFAEEDVGEDF